MKKYDGHSVFYWCISSWNAESTLLCSIFASCVHLIMNLVVVSIFPIVIEAQDHGIMIVYDYLSYI
jgi:hypothetical protein